MAYATVGPWVNGAPPAISAANLDQVETQYASAVADVQPTRSAPGRALDTIYQNTTGKPILIVVSVRCATVASAGSGAKVEMRIGSGTPPATEVAEGALEGSSVNDGKDASVCLVGLVPNNWYYRVFKTETTSGTATLLDWEEITW